MKTWKKTRKGGAEREQKGVWGETAGKIRREDLEEYAQNFGCVLRINMTLCEGFKQGSDRIPFGKAEGRTTF